MVHSMLDSGESAETNGLTSPRQRTTVTWAQRGVPGSKDRLRWETEIGFVDCTLGQRCALGATPPILALSRCTGEWREKSIRGATERWFTHLKRL